VCAEALASRAPTTIAALGTRLESWLKSQLTRHSLGTLNRIGTATVCLEACFRTEAVFPFSLLSCRAARHCHSHHQYMRGKQVAPAESSARQKPVKVKLEAFHRCQMAGIKWHLNPLVPFCKIYYQFCTLLKHSILIIYSYYGFYYL